MKKLDRILENLINYEILEPNFPPEVKGITYDSRQAEAGYIFVCIKGFEKDGHDYIENAIDNGARVIVVEKEVPIREGITYIKVNDSRAALGRLSEVFYDFANRELDLVGVTGTNGKTTTTYMVEAILRSAGQKAGLIGTIRSKVEEQIFPATRTTPESSDLQRLFAKMVEAGASHAVMEVSSHALELKRVQNLEFKVGVFTNISQDHLDFHQSLENYRKAKGKLFSNYLTEDGIGVINIDDPSGSYMVEQCTGKVLTYGIDHEADIRGSKVNVSVTGTTYQVTTPVGQTTLDLKLTGYFNVYNSLAAITTGLAFGISLEDIKKGLEGLAGVAGRFEQVDCGQNFGVVVDYAHTPDGMENVLKTARKITDGRTIAVFGCGGDRDKTKRPIMGEVGAKYSDLCILTSDNPRTEDPSQILKDVEKGVRQVEEPVDYIVIEDRREAIFKAVERAEKGDIVIILGKGHETYQIFKDGTINFDDREVAREAIRSFKA